MSYPVVNSSILLAPVENGYVAYDAAADRLHRLNPVAALILELCDGSRSPADIRDAVSPLLPAGREAEVDHWIERARDVGLVTLAASEDTHAHELSADDLVQLAGRLREHGKVQTALLCQQRAAELDTDNADVFYQLGELAHIAGKRELARDAYQRYLDLGEEDAEVRHLLVSLSDEQPPERVPDACIEQLYARFSSFYDDNVYDELGSQAPARLADVIESAMADRDSLSVLDLGCGTGISGERLRPRATRLVGIDLSKEMIDIARGRGLYDHLEVAEITDWLKQSDARFDLIVACDSLIYFGDLRQIIVPAARLLNAGGAIAFSVERSVDAPYQLTDSGRYVHHADHICHVARDADLEVHCQIESFLRMEYGEDVIGLYVALTRRSAAA